MLSYEDDFSNIIIVTIYAISILVNKVCYKMEDFSHFYPNPPIICLNYKKQFLHSQNRKYDKYEN